MHDWAEEMLTPKQFNPQLRPQLIPLAGIGVPTPASNWPVGCP